MKRETSPDWLLFGIFMTALLCIAGIKTAGSLNERPLGLVTRMIPNMSVVNIDRDTVAVKGFELFSGDTLRTDENGYALVVFMDRSTAKVRPLSQLIVHGEIDRNQRSRSRIDINAGGFFMDFRNQQDSELEIYTSHSVASVKGTRFGIDHSGYYWVEEGEVEITALETGETVTITDQMFAQISEDETTFDTGILDDEELEDLGREYKILDGELIRKRLILKFTDSNGQLREEEVIYYEQQQ